MGSKEDSVLRNCPNESVLDIAKASTSTPELGE